jgi:hypothetical protein
MKKLLVCIQVLTVAGLFLIGGVIYASALPIGALAISAANSGVELIACNPGTKDCIKTPSNQPQPCWKKPGGCKIDTGGGDCQGGPSTKCGNANQNLGTKPISASRVNPTPAPTPVGAAPSQSSAGGSHK